LLLISEKWRSKDLPISFSDVNSIHSRSYEEKSQMNSEHHATIYRKDYQPPEYLVQDLQLVFRLYESYTEVTAKAIYIANQNSTDFSGRLKLDGENLEIIAISLDGEQLFSNAYQLTEKGLTLVPGKDRFELTIVTRIDPAANTSLEGL
jgi:aminopeptidase N